MCSNLNGFFFSDAACSLLPLTVSIQLTWWFQEELTDHDPSRSLFPIHQLLPNPFHIWVSARTWRPRKSWFLSSRSSQSSHETDAEVGNSAVAVYCEREQMCLFNKCLMIACSVRASSQREIQRRLRGLFCFYGRGDRHVNSLPTSGPPKSAPVSRGSREGRTGQAETTIKGQG